MTLDTSSKFLHTVFRQEKRSEILKFVQWNMLFLEIQIGGTNFIIG
jgi:hypothetical protein